MEFSLQHVRTERIGKEWLWSVRGLLKTLDYRDNREACCLPIVQASPGTRPHSVQASPARPLLLLALPLAAAGAVWGSGGWVFRGVPSSTRFVHYDGVKVFERVLMYSVGPA